MNRITVTFLVLLSLATLTSGQLWMQSRVVLAGQATNLYVLLPVFSATILLLSLLGVGRILYKTAPIPVTHTSDGEE